ncbi:MAG: amidohydrolase family protein, partial [Acetobacteraceae bacterium]
SQGRLAGPDGTLGGAHLSLAEAVHNAHRLLGLPPAEALRLATATPAAVLGRGDQLGRLVPGARAELALFDAELALLGTWSGGRFTPA